MSTSKDNYEVGSASNIAYELKSQCEGTVSNLGVRSWCVAFSHVINCPKGEVIVILIRALPIIVTPSSLNSSREEAEN
jgi:hypothetical protein